MADNETEPKYKCLKLPNKSKGGFRASTFVFVLTALESIGFVANMVTFFSYFMGKMFFNLPHSANTLTNFMGSTFLLSILGGFISDTFLNKFATCLLFGTLEVLALIMVTVQAYSDQLRPKFCGKPTCVRGGIEVYFYTSFCILALGSGGLKGALPALGADQFDKKDPMGAKAQATYFNWLLLSSTIGAIIGVTGLVYISTKIHWYWGFFTATVTLFVGFIVFAIGKPFYRLQHPSFADSPVISIVQVIVVAIKNRKLPLPENSEQLYEITDKNVDKEKIAHTNQLRCLDKAAILPQDTRPQPWKVCTVTQVEEVKVLTRMLPILFSTIIMNTCLAQLQTFSIAQGNLMNLKLGSIDVPAQSIPVIPLVFMSILIPIYEYVFVPFARKITHHPNGITQLRRVGIGLVLSAISMAVAGIVEVKRRDQSRKDFTKPISLFWLSFQYGIFGIADMFTLAGLLEFFYKEAPEGMNSLSTSFTWLSLSFGYFLSSVFVDIINAVTRRVTPSKHGWIEGYNLDSSNLNLFYWFLAILSCLNFLNYLFWASWYKYKSEADLEPSIKDSAKLHLDNGERPQESEAFTTKGPFSSVPTEDANKVKEASL